MSKGISWRQRYMLEKIACEIERAEDKDDPIAWRAIDYGATSSESDPDFCSSQRIQWNIEQSVRRALRSMERRGLVELGSYYFSGDADWPKGRMGPEIIWSCAHPEDYVPGQGRIMTGVLLTDAGRAMVTEMKRREATPKDTPEN